MAGDQNLRDTFMFAVHLGEEGERKRAGRDKEVRGRAGRFEKLRLEILERGERTNNLRISMTDHKNTYTRRARLQQHNGGI